MTKNPDCDCIDDKGDLCGPCLCQDEPDDAELYRHCNGFIGPRTLHWHSSQYRHSPKFIGPEPYVNSAKFLLDLLAAAEGAR